MAWELSLDLDRVEANVEKATTEDLLDRATVYRNGMEPEALNLIDGELRARGVTEADLMVHRELRGRTVYAADGLAVKCEKCRRPAVVRRWGWHFIGGLLPVFPRPHAFCDLHLPTAWRAESGRAAAGRRAAGDPAASRISGRRGRAA